LERQSRCALVLEPAPGHLEGYGLVRDGSRAAYLGPVAALSPEAGLQMVEALVERNEGKKIFWDIPDENAAAVAWARQHGFMPQRNLTRMYLGENRTPGQPQMQFAIAGPEVG